jgi:hypothetical protein
MLLPLDNAIAQATDLLNDLEWHKKAFMEMEESWIPTARALQWVTTDRFRTTECEEMRAFLQQQLLLAKVCFPFWCC